MRWTVRDVVSLTVLLVCVPILFFIMRSEVRITSEPPAPVATNRPVTVSYDVTLLRHRGTKVCLLQINTPNGEHMLSIPSKACDVAFEATKGEQ